MGRRLNTRASKVLLRKGVNEIYKELSDPSKRCDVDERCLFRASGSALIGWGLQGCKIRCMVFHSFLGLLDDKALLKKARLSDLILVLMLLPTSHNLSKHLLSLFCALNTYVHSVLSVVS